MEETSLIKGFVYFLASNNNNAIYIGVTNDLKRRIFEHKSKLIEGFTNKYNCVKLVFYEEYASIIAAINREKQLKNWKRCWKNALVNNANPEWKDLSSEIGLIMEDLDPESSSG
ncbi:MAG: GIY-YIG nuclease family protein [Bacteroidales bacterium]|jgi:putative endonuclease|nr:GIY-YIG nuclease family protein [Bacteroidales bacterium]MCI2134333.1 GIY-YIG nuclease family protein [Bacteroidales bacterium]